jgi:hypothetical protein
MDLTLNFNEEKAERDESGFEGNEVSRVLFIELVVRDPERDGEEEISFPEVRLVRSDDTAPTRPYGPDRAKTWKSASEWIQELFIDRHPAVQKKRYQNRLKSEEAYFHNKEDPDLYQWQDDEELLREIRPKYSGFKNDIINEIGKPYRSDFDQLYPHQYDDPGLSERARRTVRDLKAVFGEGIMVNR